MVIAAKEAVISQMVFSNNGSKSDDFNNSKLPPIINDVKTSEILKKSKETLTSKSTTEQQETSYDLTKSSVSNTIKTATDSSNQIESNDDFTEYETGEGEDSRHSLRKKKSNKFLATKSKIFPN